MNEKCPEIKQEIAFLELFGYSYTKQKMKIIMKLDQFNLKKEKMK